MKKCTLDYRLIQLYPIDFHADLWFTETHCNWVTDYENLQIAK